MQSLIIDIALPREEYLRVYKSFVRQVKTVARNGQSVRFPVSVLQPYVSANGIYGTFQLHFDEDNKFKGIERLA